MSKFELVFIVVLFIGIGAGIPILIFKMAALIINAYSS